MDAFQSLVTDISNFDFEFEDWKTPHVHPPAARDVGSIWYQEQVTAETNVERQNVYRLIGSFVGIDFRPADKPDAPFELRLEITEELARLLFEKGKEIAFPPLRARLMDIAHIKLQGAPKREAALSAAKAYLDSTDFAERNADESGNSSPTDDWESRGVLRAFFLGRRFNDPELCKRAQDCCDSRKSQGDHPYRLEGHRVGLLEGLWKLKLQSPESVIYDINQELERDQSGKLFPRRVFLVLLANVEASLKGGKAREEYKAVIRTQAEELIRSAADSQRSAIQRTHRLKQAAALFHQIDDQERHEDCIRLLEAPQQEMLKELKEISVTVTTPVDFREVVEEWVIRKADNWNDAHRLLAAFVDTSFLSIHLGHLDQNLVGREQMMTQWRLNKKGETIAHHPAGSITSGADYGQLRLQILALQLAWAQFRLLGLHGPLEKYHVRNLVVNSQFCRESRVKTWTRGIYHGWAGDWIVSMGALIPQIEDGLREALIRRGAIPFKFSYQRSKNSAQLEEIQQKYLLNHLLFEPFTQFIPEHLVAALRLILSGRDGFNWRNLFCHGLLSDRELESPPSILTWALALVFCFDSADWPDASERTTTSTDEVTPRGKSQKS